MEKFVAHVTTYTSLIGVEVEFYMTFCTVGIGFTYGTCPGDSFVMAVS